MVLNDISEIAEAVNELENCEKIIRRKTSRMTVAAIEPLRPTKEVAAVKDEAEEDRRGQMRMKEAWWACSNKAICDFSLLIS